MKKTIVYLLLALIIGLNIYLYRGEFKVVSDPNDNIFHYALIDEAKNIWKGIFSGKLSPFYLLDSWNERWSEGFNLSTFYSHLPQAAISLLSFVLPVSAFKLFVVIRTLMLIFLPLSFFWAIRILDLPVLYGVIVAFFSQGIITHGLYGLDASSYVWRGWGLSAQLTAAFFLPLAFAYTITYIKDKKNLFKAIIFNLLVAQSHFGLFFLLLFCYPIFWLFQKNDYFKSGKRLIILLFITFVFLAYFILPFFTLGLYRNFSYWDQIWKFNSYGINYILASFTNGDLFDYNRFPLITIFLFVGLIKGLLDENKIFSFLCTLFGVYLILFFGRTTLGPIINLIPGFSEYHLHRIIIMVQFIGLFLSGWGLYSVVKYLFGFSKKIGDKVPLLKLIITAVCIILGGLLIYYFEKPVIKYADENNQLIELANSSHNQDYPDYKVIINKLSQLPRARIYAGRPGNWGKEFKVGHTQVYMALSKDGFSTSGYSPESWSPNTDQEQFFNENDQTFYNLYNIGYLVQPTGNKAPGFANLIIKKGKYALYRISTTGWFSFGQSNVIVSAKKTDLLNIIHLWFNSPLMKAAVYPEINLGQVKAVPGRALIQMSDLNHYFSGQENRSLWQEDPLSFIEIKKLPAWKKNSEQSLVNGYKANISIDEDCNDCVIILKQSYNPNWQVKINGVRVKAFPVFPFYIGIPVITKGSYEVEVIYKPSSWKIFFTLFGLGFWLLIIKYRKKIVQL